MRQQMRDRDAILHAPSKLGQEACRRPLGIEAPVVDEFPASETLDRLRAWSGSDVTLPELNGAQRQRRLIAAGATPSEVYAESVRETQDTYLQETVR